MQPSSARLALDSVDHQILGMLQHDADATNKAMAVRLGLAESTCAYRVRQLREKGIIQGSRVMLDLALLGYPLQAMITVRLGSHNQALVKEFFDAIIMTPRVLQVFHVAGSADFLVHVAVADAAALRDIVLERITVHDVVRATETQLVFERRDGAGVVPPL